MSQHGFLEQLTAWQAGCGESHVTMPGAAQAEAGLLRAVSCKPGACHQMHGYMRSDGIDLLCWTHNTHHEPASRHCMRRFQCTDIVGMTAGSIC